MESGATVASPAKVVSPTAQPSAGQPSLAARQRESRRAVPTTPAFLSNLGKATLRGIRKCPQCGVYNGTRGLSCKNKACGIVLRDGTTAGRGTKKSVIEVVRVVIDDGEPGNGRGEEGEGSAGEVAGSGSEAQVFSVCQRSRGGLATQLGFVELVPTDTAIATGDGATLLTRINLGRCYLPACRQGQRSAHQVQSQQASANASQKASSSSSDSLCVHIKQAMECQSRATPLPLKSSVLESCQSAQARIELWGLATESPGPLVQRVSKDTLVVKCHTSSTHPLGLLHLTVGAGGLSEISKGEGKGRQGQQAVFHCTCQASSRGRKSDVGTESQTGPKASSTSPSGPYTTGPELCLHFYACVCAFASDDELASDFAGFIDYGANGVQQNLDCRIMCGPDKSALQPEPIAAHHKVKTLRLEEPATAVSAVCLGVGSERLSPPSLRKAGQKKVLAASGLKTPGSTQFVDEHTVSLGFHHWLASVTERIHQTMHYQFNGKPEPLVFHIPQEFFNSLQHRLSLGSKKRRLPNMTTAFVRNNGLPLGSFSKYIWHITNLMQVKRIFDTPELPLELTQSFVRNMDGTYSPFRCPDPPPEADLSDGCRADRPLPIRPLELRTFLKVGTCTADQKEATPFVIEWIPDILPRSRIGELRIGFEFGHQQRGQPDFCEGMLTQRGGSTERGGRGKSAVDPAHPKHTQTVEILQLVV